MDFMTVVSLKVRIILFAVLIVVLVAGIILRPDLAWRFSEAVTYIILGTLKTW